MRVLVVEPGPHFSVADVCRGWTAGLREIGCDVVQFNLADRLNFYTGAHLERDGEFVPALPTEAALALATKGIEVACYEFWPDVVLVVSGFYLPPALYGLIRDRGHRLVLHHTESPYEDERQLQRAPLADLNLLNDPMNLDRFSALAPSVYMPHAYDPAIHHPRPARPELASDFCFVGTGYPSRIAFLEAVEWSGLDVALAGNWQALGEDSPLRKFVAHDIEHCVDNTEAVELYASTKVSANLYRREADRPEHVAGWAVSPREVELAACGTFFLREPRGEGDDLFPMLPMFDGPGSFGDTLRFWTAHAHERAVAAADAREAVADRTFAANARRLLDLL